MTERQKRITQIVLIEALFLVLAFGCFTFGILSQHVTFSPDSIFHWQRVCNLVGSVRHGQWPAFNHYVMFYGNAAPTMYPWLNIIIAGLYRILGATPVMAFYLFMTTVMFIGLNVAYFVSHRLFHKTSAAVLFSIFYCISTLILMAYYPRCDIGEYTDSLLLPLAFYGWFLWIRHGNWRWLTAGLSLLFFNHLISTVLCIITMMILTIFERKRLNRTKWIHLAYAAITFLSVTAIIWVPILALFMTNNIVSPRKIGLATGAHLIPNNWDQYIYNLHIYTTLTDVAALGLGAYFWNQLPKSVRHIYWTSIILLMLNFNWWPWKLLAHTPVQTIQFTARVCFSSHFLLTYVLIYLIFKVIPTHYHSIEIVAFSVLMLLSCSMSAMDNAKGIYYGSLFKPLSTTHQFTKKHMKVNETMVSNYVVKMDNADMSSQEFMSIPSHYDYSTRGLKDTYKRQFYHKHHDKHGNLVYKFDYKNVNSRISNGRLIMDNHQRKHILRTPMCVYNSQKYHITLNGKPAHWRSANGDMELINVPKGKLSINYQAPLAWYRSVSFVVTALGLVFLSIRLPRRKDDKNENR